MLPLYNAEGGVHRLSRVDRVIAKPPYNKGAFNILRSNGKGCPVGVQQLPYQNPPCNEGCTVL